MTSRLGPAERAAGILRAQSERFDLVVIGGGVTGTGVALDAASRGLSVCLVEKRDFASGTSSRSSKLIHGGLRYLEQRDFGLVREALRERRVLLEDVAPHLVRPAPFLLPLRHRVWERAYIGAGVLLYDVLAGRKSAVPHHRHLSRKQCLAIAPSLARDSLVGGIEYHDAQIDDARHTVVVARTAAREGAVCLSGLAVERVLVQRGAAVGVEVTDREEPGSAPFAIRGDVVVNATGVWTTIVEESAGVTNPMRVRASKGIHIVVPRSRIRSETAVILRTEKSVLFLIPWGDRWVIGTTDTDWTYDLDHPAASRTDIDYVLEWANSMLSDKLGREDVVGVYAGLRPLISGGATATTKLSREHAINVSMPKFVSIAGGKYTTYRLMAVDAVDAAGRELGRTIPKSRTHEIPLLGAEGHEGAVVALHSHPGAVALPPEALVHLVARYGSAASEVLDVIAERPAAAASLPSGGMAELPSTEVRLGVELRGELDPDSFDAGHRQFRDGGRYLLAEAVHAVRYEGARHVADVLTRRTRLSIEADDRGVGAAALVAETIGAELGWDAGTIGQESAHYLERVAAERHAETMPDDARADAVRSPVRDARLIGGHRR